MSNWTELWGDRSDPYGNFANRMNEVGNQFNPYIDRGQEAGNMIWGQDQRLVNNPNSVQDQIAGGFYLSPYQKYLLDQTTKRMNYNSANTGMLGSGAANRALEQELNNMTGGFMNDYINRGMESYGMGMNNATGLNQMGFDALGQKAGYQETAAAAQLGGDMSRAQGKTNMWGRIGGALAGGAAGFMGGGWGGAVSGALQGAGFGNQMQNDPRRATGDIGSGGGYGVYDPRRYQ